MSAEVRGGDRLFRGADRLFRESDQLFRRAARVIPRGIYGTRGPWLVTPGSYPLFAARGRGAHYWDVDGNEYIDYLCGFGACILGYGDDTVDTAARAAERAGSGFNHPTAAMVELAEFLTGRIYRMDWALFGKNGSDMTTFALQVARRHTGRRTVLKAAGAYHGSYPWSTPGHAGLTAEDTAHVHDFTWNDFAGTEELLAAHAHDLAAVIVTPYHHPLFFDSEFSENGFLQRIGALAHEYGALIISDDVRVGFRASLDGSHSAFGFRADLTCFSKAIANGYPIAVCMGIGGLMPAASAVFTTGTFWMHQGPMAAALACLQRLKEIGAVTLMHERGTRLVEGLQQVATRHGEQLHVSGLPSMPKVRFATENDFMRFQQFCAAATRRGAYLHPYHNWFLSAAHTEEDIDRTIDIADAALAEVVAGGGPG